MSDTYNCENLKYEEKIVPKEIKSKGSSCAQHSSKFASDDLFLLIILLLFTDTEKDDNLFLILLIAVIFLK